MNLYTCIGATGWRRLIECLKLQVICHKRATNYRALLRKMTYEDKAFYDATPPIAYMGIFTSLLTLLYIHWHFFIHIGVRTYMLAFLLVNWHLLLFTFLIFAWSRALISSALHVWAIVHIHTLVFLHTQCGLYVYICISGYIYRCSIRILRRAPLCYSSPTRAFLYIH